jgi:hypothetical protein
VEDVFALSIEFPNGEAGAAVLEFPFEPKPPNMLFCVVEFVLKSPPVGADVEALLLVNMPPEAGALSLFFAAEPRKVNSLAAGMPAALFCEAPKAGVCDDCAPKVKLLAGAGVVAEKFRSGCGLKGDAPPALLPPKPEAGGKDALVDCANGLLGVADCAGGKLLVELLPNAKMPAPDAFCCCDCPNRLPPGVLCCCAKGLEAAPALGSGPKLKPLAEGGAGLKPPVDCGFGLKAARPCAQMLAIVAARAGAAVARVLVDAAGGSGLS